MTEIQTLTRAVISGEIRRVLFDSGDGRYAVLRLADGTGAEHVICGPLCGLAPGQNIEAEGHWEKHAEFGNRFRAESFRLRLPSTPEGIKRFLGSGAIPGIGSRTAEIIVDHFGGQTLTILDRFSKRLLEVPGIGPKKAEAIIQGWRESAARRESYIFLQGLGITPAYCARLFRQYGERAPEVVRANPYRLAEEVDGIGFLKADEIAGALGVARDSVDRMAAACVYTVNTLVGSGHVCCPEPELLRQTAELAGQEADRAAAGLEAALERGLLRRADGMIYTPLLLRAETELPKLIAALATARRFAGQSLRPLPGEARFQAG